MKKVVPMNEDGEEIGIGGGVWHDGITTHTSYLDGHKEQLRVRPH